MAEHQLILILDFGGQYTQLIARRVRENHVYSEVAPWNMPIPEIAARRPAGIILSGGPASVCDPDAPRCGPSVYELGVPVLGICYGMQLTAQMLGGQVERAKEREYGRVTVRMKEKTGLLDGMKDASSCWMSHTWQVKNCPPGFHPIAETDSCPIAAMANEDRHIYGVQFHPEVTHTEEGKALLHNFLFKICHCAGDYTRDEFCFIGAGVIGADVPVGEIQGAAENLDLWMSDSRLETRVKIFRRGHENDVCAVLYSRFQKFIRRVLTVCILIGDGVDFLSEHFIDMLASEFVSISPAVRFRRFFVDKGDF